MPAFSAAGSVMPIFITSKSTENEGDGIYRIRIDKDGTISLKNSASALSYQYIFNSDMPCIFKPILLTNVVYQFHKAMLSQQSVLENCQRELKEICDEPVLTKLQDVQRGYSSGTVNIEDYFRQSSGLHDTISINQKREKRLAVVSKFADFVTKNVVPTLMRLKVEFKKLIQLPEVNSIAVLWYNVFEEISKGDFVSASLEQLLPFYSAIKSINVPVMCLFFRGILPSLTSLGTHIKGQQDCFFFKIAPIIVIGVLLYYLKVCFLVVSQLMIF